MHVVALLAQKGGVGKTTLAVSLAVQAELAGFRSGIVDADPQANASGWFINRQKKQKKESPVVASVNDPAKVHDAVALALLCTAFLSVPPGLVRLAGPAGGLLRVGALAGRSRLVRLVLRSRIAVGWRV